MGIFGNYVEESDDYVEKTLIKTLIKLFPWLFQRYMYNILVNVLLRFNSFMTGLTFCCHLWTAISSFNAVFLLFFCPKLSNQALNQTRKTGYRKSDN